MLGKWAKFYQTLTVMGHQIFVAKDTPVKDKSKERWLDRNQQGCHVLEDGIQHLSYIYIQM